MIGIVLLTIGLRLVQPLILNASLKDLHLSLQNRSTFLRSLDFRVKATLEKLPQILSHTGSCFRVEYERTRLFADQAAEIYNEYIGRPSLHRVVLPIEFLFRNPDLLQRIEKDWILYKPGVLEIHHAYPILIGEPWKSRILEYVAEHPEAVGLGIAGHWGEKAGIAKAWELNVRKSPISPQIVEYWTQSRPKLLVLLHIFIIDPLLINSEYDFIKIQAEHDGDQFIFIQFVFNSSRGHFDQVLQRIRYHLNGESRSRLALWHGKLLKAAMRVERINNDSSLLRDIWHEFVAEYEAEELPGKIIAELATEINHRMIFVPPLEEALNDKLMKFHLLYPRIPPLTGNRHVYLEYWLSIQRSWGTFQPPLGAWDWKVACDVLSSTENECKCRSVVRRHFSSPFLLQQADGQVISCLDIECLLDEFPRILIAESGAFHLTLTDEYDLIYSEDQPVALWEAIARVLLLGFAYREKDVFHLSEAVWKIIYAIPAADDPWVDRINRILASTKFLSMSGYRQIPIDH
jgi:hypothetical protein